MADRTDAGSSGIMRAPLIGGAALIALIAAMALDTTFVRIGSDAATRQAGFDAASFGQAEFPTIHDFVVENAVAAPILAEAVQEDQAAAGQEYGVGEGFGPVVPVQFTGVAGEPTSGVYPVAVEGVPEGITIRVQTGPAINGTDLRDATGTIDFGQFTNQIEYQNAGAAINEAMREEVLAPLDTSALEGETIAVAGVFKLINPSNWMVTPVRMSVE